MSGWADVEQLTGIVVRGQHGVDRRCVGRGDGQEVGLVELAVLVVAEVEGAVLDEGATHRDAGLDSACTAAGARCRRSLR